MRLISIKFESVLPAARPILFSSLASCALPFTLPTRIDKLISGIATARLCLQSHRLDTPCIGHCPLFHAFPTRRLGQSRCKSFGVDSSLLPPPSISAVPHKHTHAHTLFSPFLTLTLFLALMPSQQAAGDKRRAARIHSHETNLPGNMAFAATVIGRLRKVSHLQILFWASTTTRKNPAGNGVVKS